LSDLLLIEQCKSNNRKAQMALYKKYCNGMFSVAQRYIKDTAEAEDALQEAFIKAFQKLDQFKGDVTFGAWLKRIVINSCLDAIKAKKMVLDEINESLLHIANDDEDSWSISHEASAKQVINTIATLKDKYRLVLQLYLLEGYDHQEISEVLQISENTSRTNLHRGKAILKQSLNRVDYGTGY